MALLEDNSPEGKAKKLILIKPVLDVYMAFLGMIHEKKILESQVNLLTHNDLIHGNVLWDLEKLKYQFIDFEYAGFNMIGSDIINICLESIYEYDLPDWPFYQRKEKVFGSDEHMDHLIHTYLAFFKLYLISRAKKLGVEYIQRVPTDLLQVLELDLSQKESPFDDELELLEKAQTKEFSEGVRKSKVFSSINKDQIRFIKR